MTETPVQKELRQIARKNRWLNFNRLFTAAWGLAGICGLILLFATRARGSSSAFNITAVVALIAAISALALHFRRKYTVGDVAKTLEREKPELNTLLQAAAEQRP